MASNASLFNPGGELFPPLAAGDYVLLLQDIDSIFDYELQFNVSAVGPAFDADFDLDDDVDGADLAQWGDGFGLSAGAAHAEGDDDVDGADFLAWQREFGSDLPAVSIPEPASLGLLLIAAACCVRRRRDG